jgi:signal transduction histidine kinase
MAIERARTLLHLPSTTYVRDSALLFVAYFVTARVGLALDVNGDIAPSVWPACGVGLAAFMLRGISLWPALAAAALIANWSFGIPPVASAGMAVGDTLSPVLGAWLMCRGHRGTDAPLDSARGVVAFVGLAAMLSTTVNASVGSLSVWLTNEVVGTSFFQLWIGWWSAAALGDLIVAPLLIATASSARPQWSPALMVETTVASMLLCIVSIVIFSAAPASRVTLFTYAMFPPLLWLAVSARQPATSVGMCAMAIIAVTGTLYGRGPFAGVLMGQNLLELQTFLAVAMLSGLLFAALATQLRNAAEKLLASERLAMMGSISASIGHEINNPLASLSLSLEMLCKLSFRNLQQLPEQARVRQLLVSANESTQRMRGIVENMRLLARGGDPAQRVVDVATILESAIELIFQTEIAPRAKLVKDYAEVPLVAGDPIRLYQVFVNLLMNAAHAIPKGHAEDNTIRITALPSAGRRVEVSISDTGLGIRPEDCRRIFEPFFSTKPNGEGVGLGLAVSRALVTSCGGAIEVHSIFGGGTTVRVLLSAVDADAAKKL